MTPQRVPVTSARLNAGQGMGGSPVPWPAGGWNTSERKVALPTLDLHLADTRLGGDDEALASLGVH
jgi:hypothetical protein